MPLMDHRLMDDEQLACTAGPCALFLLLFSTSRGWRAASCFPDVILARAKDRQKGSLPAWLAHRKDIPLQPLAATALRRTTARLLLPRHLATDGRRNTPWPLPRRGPPG